MDTDSTDREFNALCNEQEVLEELGCPPLDDMLVRVAAERTHYNCRCYVSPATAPPPR